MLLTPSVKTLASIPALLALVLVVHNPAVGLVNQPTSFNSNKLTLKKSTLQADTFLGPQRDFRISIPGRVTENTEDQLTSVSDDTQTAYTIRNIDLPGASRIPNPQIRQVLQSAMWETIGRTGKVIKTTNLVIDGHPGLELLMQYSDDSVGQYRAFVVNQRLYFMGAVAPYGLTTESTNFFDSFRVYPEQIINSRFGTY